jgi:hypothetical protein
LCAYYITSINQFGLIINADTLKYFFNILFCQRKFILPRKSPYILTNIFKLLSASRKCECSSLRENKSFEQMLPCQMLCSSDSAKILVASIMNTENDQKIMQITMYAYKREGVREELMCHLNYMKGDTDASCRISNFASYCQIYLQICLYDKKKYHITSYFCFILVHKFDGNPSGLYSNIKKNEFLLRNPTFIKI